MTRYTFIDAEKARYPVRTLCRCLGVSRAGYYAWAARPPSARAIADRALAERIRVVHEDSRRIYGAPRIHAELRELGVRCGRKRVARLMRAAGRRGVCRRRFRTGCTKRDPLARPAPDLVNREFRADAPNQLWTADVTYVPTVEGWLYLAVVLDVFSRRVLGWSMRGDRSTQLVVDAVAMAIARRGGQVAGVIHHSDQGAEYTSHAIEHALRQAGIRASMGSTGEAYDNALTESFFATLETELFDHEHGGRFASRRAAKLAIFDWIETFYNCRRRHSALGYLAPDVFEAQRATSPEATA